MSQLLPARRSILRVGDQILVVERLMIDVRTCPNYSFPPEWLVGLAGETGFYQ
jgi:hypothetical protein